MNSQDFSKFKRSDSRPGFWRSSSQYVRQPTRSRSKPRFEFRKDFNRDRSKSFSRREQEKGNDKFQSEVENIKKNYSALEKKTDAIAKSNEEILKILEKLEKKSSNVSFVEDIEMKNGGDDVSIDIMDVMFARDIKETDVMILDTGCPEKFMWRKVVGGLSKSK